MLTQSMRAKRMAGLLNLLLRKAPGGPTVHVDHDQYLEQAAMAPLAGSAQLDGLRTIALYYELYQEQEDWRAAALGLAKFASDVSFRRAFIIIVLSVCIKLIVAIFRLMSYPVLLCSNKQRW